ncbi:MAG: HK97 family phage prohead protease [Planctomycetes bacterium]|nr:HK97 family phage prohead protease [Planctomycetota bacterium]
MSTLPRSIPKRLRRLVGRTLLLRSKRNGRTRTAEVTSVRVVEGEDGRTFEITFSSNTNRVRRYCPELGGVVPEILHHSVGGVDLEPARVAGCVLFNHNPAVPIASILKIWIDEDAQRGRAIIRFGSTPDAELALQQMQDGMLKGISFGYEPLEGEYVRSGQSFEIDGIEYDGPCFVVTRWSVYEVTATTIPADYTVGVGRTRDAGAAAFSFPLATRELAEIIGTNRTSAMSEFARRRGLPKRGGNYLWNRKCALRAARKWGSNNYIAIRNALEAIPDESNLQGASVSAPYFEGEHAMPATVTRDRTDTLLKRAESALVRALPSFAPVARNDEYTRGVAPVRDFEDLARRCVEARGERIDNRDGRETIYKRALSGGMLSALVANVAQKLVVPAYKSHATWRSWVPVTDDADFKGQSRVILEGLGYLPETPENGELKEANLSASAESIRAIALGTLFKIPWELFFERSVRWFDLLMMNAGRAVANAESRLVYTHLLANANMADGVPLFHADRGNLATGGGSALGLTGLGAAETGFYAHAENFQVGSPNLQVAEPVGVAPDVLIVPPALRATALDLVRQVSPGGEPSYIVEAEPRLSQTGFHANVSATRWFIAAAATELTGAFELAHVHGVDNPIVTEDRKDVSFLGVKFRVHFAAGVKAVNPKLIQRNDGA